MIRKATNSDSRVLAEMAVQMWDDNTVNELEIEFLKTLNDEQSAFFIKVVLFFQSISSLLKCQVVFLVFYL